MAQGSTLGSNPSRRVRRRDQPPPQTHAEDVKCTSPGSCLSVDKCRTKSSRKPYYAGGGRPDDEQRLSLLKASEPAGLLLTSSWANTTTETADDDTTATTELPPVDLVSIRSPASVTSPASLLTLPSPIDRRRQRKQLYYEGEQEPEGIRGQEAVVGNKFAASPFASVNHSPPVRVFSPDTRKSPERVFGSTPSRGMRSPARGIRSPSRVVRSTSLRDSVSVSSILTDEREPDTRRGPMSQNANAILEVDEHEDSTSTQSSQDIHDMMPDFLPSNKGRVDGGLHGLEDLNREVPHSSLTMARISRVHPLPTPKSQFTHDDSALNDSTQSSENLRRIIPDQSFPPSPTENSNSQRYMQYSFPNVTSPGSNANESTNSSEDLRRMRPDLIPTPSPAVANNSLGRPPRASKHDSPNRPPLTSIITLRAVEPRSPRLSPRKSAPVDIDDSTFVDAPYHVDAINAVAVEHVENGEYDTALIAYGEVLAAYRELYGDKHPLVASAYHNLGMVHSKRATLLSDGTHQQNHCRQQSLECFQAAARTARDSLGRNHPNVAVSLVRIGFLLLQARQYQNAIVTFREALRIRIAHYGEDKPHGLIANLYNNLGVCHMHLGLYTEGSVMLDKALAIQRQVLRIKREDENVSRDELRNFLLEVADTLCNQGGLCLEWIRQQGPDVRHAKEAESAFAEALEIRTAILGPSHPLVQQVHTLHSMAKSTPLPKPRAREKPRPESARSKPRQLRILPQDNEPMRMTRSVSSGSALVQHSPGQIGGQATSREGGQRRCAPLPLLEVTVVTPDSREIGEVSPSSTYTNDEQWKPGKNPGSKVWGSPQSADRKSVRGSPARQLKPSLEPEQSFLVDTPGSDSSVPSSSLWNNLRAKGLDRWLDAHNDGKSGENSPVNYLKYDVVEESCLIGDAGAESDGATIHFLSLLDENDGKGQPVDELKLSSHEITIVRPFGGSKETSRSAVHPLTGRTSSWSEASSQNGGSEGRSPSKKYYDSPAVKLHEDDGLYAACQEESSEFGAWGKHGQSSEIDDASDGGLAPLGDDWPTSKPSHTEIILRTEMLDNPEEHLKDVYDAASGYLKRNQYAESLHLFQSVLDCQRRIHGELHEDVGSALHNVGIVHLRAEHHEMALEAFEKAVRVRKGALGRDHPEVAVSLVKVGISQLLLRNFEMALLAFRDALSIRRHSLGALHPSTARVYNNIGCVHVEFNELRDARRAFEAALDIQRNALCHEPDSGPLMFGAATTLCNLGYLYKYREMHEKAALVLNEALSLQERILGPTHPTVLSTMDNLAEACAKSRNCTVALRYYDEILGRFHKANRSSRDTARVKKAEAVLLYKMSRVHREQNDRESELYKLELALKAMRAISTSPSVGNDRERGQRLERRILGEVRKVKEDIEKSRLDWL